MAIRHIVIDLGGVLFRFDHARRLALLSDLFSMDADRVDALLWRSGFSAECDGGRYGTADEVRAALRTVVGFEGGDEELNKGWCSAFSPDDAVVAQLRQYRGDVPLTLFTNNGPLEEEVLPRLFPEAFESFGQLLFSYRFGLRKPDRAAFEAAARRLGAGSGAGGGVGPGEAPGEGEVVFVDDSSTNVEAARAFGWTALRFEGPETIARALAAPDSPSASPA
jgi:FMN phosphatase YigB (HAD superfamily)